MHERTRQDLFGIIARDVFPMGAMPNERQQTTHERAKYLAEEIALLADKNRRLEDLVAIAYTLGASGCFELWSKDSSENDVAVLEILASRKLISKEPVAVYKSKVKESKTKAIAESFN